MTTFNWTIPQMVRLTFDGFVVTVHYRVAAVDAEFVSTTYGSINYTQDPDTAYIPYDQLTESEVIGWVQNSLGKDVVESSLQSQIDAKKQPVQEFGTPWSSVANNMPLI